jgi:hypothetical protein
VRIPEDPHDRWARSETRKAIRIPQPVPSSRCWHAAIMHNSRAAAAAFPTAASAGSRIIRPLFSPTHFDEEPQLFSGYLSGDKRGQSRDVPLWSRQAGDEPQPNRIANRHCDNGDSLGRVLRS